MQILLSILAFFLFIGLVLIHEWGHYIVARRNGVKVEEFGLGLPPQAWGKKLKSGIILSLNWLPLGGFVKLKGEHDADNRPGTFGAASLWAKTKIMLAGVTMNFVAGILLLTILALVGMPKLLNKSLVGEDQFTVASDTRIIRQEVRAGYVQPGSPASKIGLDSRDIIVNLRNGSDFRQVTTPSQLYDTTKAFAGQSVTITYEHHDQVITKNVKLLTEKEVEASSNSDSPKGYLGLVPVDLQVRRSTWSAPIVAIGFTKQLIVLTMKALGHSLSGLGSTIAGGVTGNSTAREHGQDKASSQVGGPLAIGVILWSSGSLGINFVLMLIAIISLTLALMNLLPIPALDGGRLMLSLISRGILRRPLSKTAEERIVGAGMVLILALFALITLVDIKRFF